MAVEKLQDIRNKVVDNNEGSKSGNSDQNTVLQNADQRDRSYEEIVLQTGMERAEASVMEQVSETLAKRRKMLELIEAGESYDVIKAAEHVAAEQRNAN